MAFIIRKAAAEDIGTVLSLIASGRELMRRSGNVNQWPEGTPSEALLMADIAAGNSCLVMDGDTPVATFAFVPGPDPTYTVIEGGSWLDDAPYYVIHRMARSANVHGVFRAVLDWCFARVDNIRIDTHRDNAPMRHCITAYGFTCCGIIFLADGSERLAYQMHRP